MSNSSAANKALFDYLLWLGDNSLVLGHRLSEWCGHGPVLEEDIAMTNIALDLIGQARLYLSLAGDIEGKGRSEDELAYLRDVMFFKNTLLVEQVNGDFASTMMRQFLFTVFNYHLQNAMLTSTNEQLRSIAEKAIKETTYHLRHCSDWVIRLGDGTEESHKRLQDAVDTLWMFTGDLFETLDSDKELIAAKIVPDLKGIRDKWIATVKEVLSEATITIPEESYMMKGGRKGIHTEHLGFLLAELQFMQRAYPGAKW
ncbi:MAG TPA: 1,2-phenylacetyl-CoA epoxidase subunit PaaC [Bacteroidia bacterium]|jgi:ring-1,2-phenylacetyl-CoA epoxidase subunit PaaC|nr:1,2-phenylacetyl-CoA epoxidase subunit PaaC [Bacteroidia bacterium]